MHDSVRRIHMEAWILSLITGTETAERADGTRRVTLKRRQFMIRNQPEERIER
jgi:hypothetical protein